MPALDNILVLDLSRGYPPAMATTYLADFGARVVRIDPPAADPRALQLREGRHAAFMPRGRNKQSLILDLKKPAGREVLFEMAKRADVLIENNRPGVMDKLGCGYDVMRRVNPRLIYCACSGFGQDGPYAGLPAHDMNYISIAGVLSLVGPRDGPPCFPSNMVADLAGCAFHAAIGILIAYVARESTGLGQLVDISYTEGALGAAVGELSEFLYSGVRPVRGQTRLTGGMICVQVYRCKDGEYFTIAPIEQHLWENFCRSVGRADLISKREATGKEKDRIFEEISAIFATRTRDEWWEFFKDKNTCAAPVNYMDEAIRDPQLVHRKAIIEVDHPRLGKVRQLGVPIKLSATPGSVRTLGGPVGIDSEAVLAEFGNSKEKIAELRKLGILG